MAGRLHTCYSPVRRSPAIEASFNPAAPRLACVKPVASVHPEPGSNSSLLLSCFLFFSVYKANNTTGDYLQNPIKEGCPGIDVVLFFQRQLIIALVLTIVYCKSFNVLFSLSPRWRRKCFAKLSQIFGTTKFLFNFFYFFYFFASNFLSFDLLEIFISRKRVQRYGVFLKPPNISATFFNKNFTFSPALIALHCISENYPTCIFFTNLRLKYSPFKTNRQNYRLTISPPDRPYLGYTALHISKKSQDFTYRNPAKQIIVIS